MFSFFKRSYKIKVPFDKVYCISFCRNIQKQKDFQKVMNYLGIDFEFIYGADYNNLDILRHPEFHFFKYKDEKDEKYLRTNQWKHYTHYIGASYDHYTAVINAYESGANSVLIMEDDCAFINDYKYIEYALNNYPEDADIIKFGCWCIDVNYFKDSNIDLNTPGQYIKNRRFDGCQMYGLCNRDSIKKYIDVQKENLICCDWMFNNVYFKNIYQLVYPIVIDNKFIQKHINVYNLHYNLLENIK